MHSYSICPVLQDITLPERIAEIEVTYSKEVGGSDQPKIYTSADAAAILRSQWSKDEEVKVFYLSKDNGILGIHKAAILGVEYFLVDPKIVFAVAIKSLADGIVVTHSNPCEEMMPSPLDTGLAEKLKEISKVFELPLLDYIVLTEDGFYSFEDEGLL